MPRRPMSSRLAAWCRLRPEPPAIPGKARAPGRSHWHQALRVGSALLLAAQFQPALTATHPAPTVTKAPAVEPGSVRFTRAYGWLPVDNRRLVLWAGIEEPYLVDLVPGCADLRQAAVNGVTTHNRRLSPRTDSLVVGGTACPVERILPASGSTLRGMGLRREDARPVPILPVPPPKTP